MSRRVVKHLSQLALLSMLIVVAVGAGDSAARFDKDSHAMMCICSCNQLLGECNHVGCPDSDRMRKELAASIASGDSDDTIFRHFQEKYGPVVLAAPMFTPFNHLAWIMPPLVLFLGIGVTMLIVRKWKLRTVPMPAVRHSPAFDAVRDRVRRETQL